MLRKITKGIICVILWMIQLYSWMFIFETWPFFNQVINETIALILSMILAVFSSYGIIGIIKRAWEHN